MVGTGGILGHISVVVTLHLVVEDLGFLGRGVGDEALLDDAEDVVTDVAKLVLDLDLVVLDNGHVTALEVSVAISGSLRRPRYGCLQPRLENKQVLSLWAGSTNFWSLIM